MLIDYSKSALLIIDMQNDFCGGALAVKGGAEAAAPLSVIARKFAAQKAPVIASQDWHPAGHSSFKEKGGMWPPHCIQGTAGADFYPALDMRPVTLIIRKGFRPELDSYSAFFENDKQTVTGLDAFLRRHSVKSIYIGGLALDYCVFFTAMDALSSGFKVYILKDCTRGVDFPDGSIEKAISQMKEAGVEFIEDSGIIE